MTSELEFIRKLKKKDIDMLYPDTKIQKNTSQNTFVKGQKEILVTGLQLGAGSATLSALPANDITPQVTRGFARFAGFFPTFGKLAGAGLVISGASRVTKVVRQLPRSQRKIDTPKQITEPEIDIAIIG